MALEQHIRRVNYQVAIWKRAHLNTPHIPNPTQGHGWHMVDGCLEPLWVDGPIIPRNMEELLEPALEEADDDGDEGDEFFEEIWENIEEYFNDDDD